MALVINRVFEAVFEKIANEYSGEDFTKEDLLKLFNEYGNESVVKSTKNKDPNAPKKYTSSYIHYGQINRGKIIDSMNTEYNDMSKDELTQKADEIFKKVKKDKHQKITDWIEKPVATQTEIMKRCGVEWKNLSEKKKEKYTKVAEEDKVRYEKDLEKYKTTDEYKQFNK